MSLFFLEPEVAGGHGEGTVYKERHECNGVVYSDNVEYLHYEMDGWLGDDLLESTPAFIVTNRLAQALSHSKFNDGNYRLEECLVTTSDMFDELHEGLEIPKFYRFIPLGEVLMSSNGYENWTGQHFNITPMSELVVTDEALSFLQQFSVSQCDISEVTPVEL